MTRRAWAGGVSVAVSVLGAARLEAQSGFPLRGTFVQHEITIEVTGTCVASSTTRSTVTTPTAAIPLPAVTCPGKAALSGTVQLTFPAQTPPAVWQKSGLHGLSFGFQGGIIPSIAAQGSWQITPGAPPDPWQNHATMTSAAGVGPNPVLGGQDVPLSSAGSTVTLAASDQRLLGNIRDLNKTASWDGERVSGHVPSAFWTQITDTGGSLVRVHVSVKSWYTFTSGQPFKNDLYGHLTEPGCPIILQRGATVQFKAELYHNLVSEDEGTVHLEVTDVPTGDVLGQSAPGPVYFVAPNMVQEGVFPSGEPKYFFWDPLIVTLAPIALPDRLTVLTFEAVLRGKSGTVLARVTIAELNVSTPRDEELGSLRFEPPTGQTFRPGVTAQFEASLRVRLESRPEADARLVLYDSVDNVLARSAPERVLRCDEGRSVTLALSRVVAQQDTQFTLRAELHTVDTGARFAVLGAAGYGVRHPGRIQIIEVKGEAEIIKEGQEEHPIPAVVGDLVEPSDRIYTGLDSRVKLLFPDTSTMILSELTDARISLFVSGPDAIKNRIWLSSGSIDARINHPSPVRSDFAIKMPTATCSVRGTALTVSYVESPMPTATVTVSEGSAEVVTEDPSVFAATVADGTVQIVWDPATGEYTVTGDHTPPPLSMPTLIGYDVERFAAIFEPADLAMDAAGNLVSVSMSWGELLRFAPDRSSSTIAALPADMDAWRRLALGPDGAIYLSHFLDREVWRVAPDGSTREVVLARIDQPTGLATDTAGNLFACSRSDNTVTRRAPGGAEDRSYGRSVGEADPLAIDAAGNLFAGDGTFGMIRRVPAGGGIAQLVVDLDRGPTALALRPDGAFLVGFPGPKGAGEVATVTAGGAVRTIGSGFSRPSGFASGPAGVLYVADLDDDMIYRAVPMAPGTPRMVLETAQLEFGTLNAGRTAQRSFTIGNTGSGDLAVDAAWAAATTQFTVVSPALPFGVPPGEEREVTVRFAPTEAQPHYTWLNLTTTDPARPTAAITVLAEGVVPTIASVSPGAVAAGGSLWIRGLYFGATPEENTVRFGGRTLALGTADSSEIVAFVPDDMPAGFAALTIEVAGYSSAPFDIQVTPSGGTPYLECAPTVLHFGNVTLGESRDLEFTAMNSGDGAAVVTRIDFDNDAFSAVAPALPLRLGPGEEAKVTVRFTPDSPWPPETGRATMISNDPSNPYVDLDGRGWLPPRPVIASLTPDRGPVGAEVLIAGDYFGRSAAHVLVLIDWIQAPVLEVEPTRIRTAIPVGAHVGAVYVRVMVYEQTNQGDVWFQVTGGGATAAPVITSALEAEATREMPFNYSITAINEPASFGAGGLPAGLEVDGETGALTGEPQARGTFLVTISAGNSLGTDTATLTLRVGDLADDLVAYYPFSGSANDAGGCGFDGAAHGGVALAADRAGNPNAAYAFNGSTGYIDLGAHPALKPGEELTVALWAYRSSWNPGGAEQSLFSNTEPGQGYGLRLLPEPAMAAYVGKQTDGFGAPLLKWTTEHLPAAWHHFAVSCDGQNTVFYVDGAIEGWQTSSAARPLAYDSDNHTLIGAEAGPGGGTSPPPEGRYFAGTLDEVAIFRRALDGPEIARLMTAVPAPSGIEAWRRARFGQNAAAPAIGGDLDDPDGDELENLLEYFIGGDPTVADAGGADIGVRRGAVPDEVVLTFIRSAAADDVAVAVEGSSDLAGWTGLAARSAGSQWQPSVPWVQVTEQVSGDRVTVTVVCAPHPARPVPLFLRYRVIH